MKEAAIVREEPGEVLILFKRGLERVERNKFLEHLFILGKDLGDQLEIKRTTDDGAGVLLGVPYGREGWYIGYMRCCDGFWQIQFVQRHHVVHHRRPASAGH